MNHPPGDRQIHICQHRTCRKQGSSGVLTAFQTASLPPGTLIIESGCLGQCGNGPMVLIRSDEVWYCGVQPDEVLALVDRHLWQGTPIKSMLYRKFHDHV